MPLYERRNPFEQQHNFSEMQRKVFTSPLITDVVVISSDDSSDESLYGSSQVNQYFDKACSDKRNEITNKSSTKLCNNKKKGSNKTNGWPEKNDATVSLWSQRNELPPSDPLVRSTHYEAEDAGADKENESPSKNTKKNCVSNDTRKKQRKEGNKIRKSPVSDDTIESSQMDVPAPSDPLANYNHYQRLIWLQEYRIVGLHVQCDLCKKYRYLKDVHDPLELPSKWDCSMNPDAAYNSCHIPQQRTPADERIKMIYNKYNAGSVVWAKSDGYPWWPAMVDDDPDMEQYYWLEGCSDEPTWYNVVFFDTQEVTKEWLSVDKLHKYKGHENDQIFTMDSYNGMFKKRIDVAAKQAANALTIHLLARLRLYSFISRSPYPIVAPVDKPVRKGKRTNDTRRKDSSLMPQSKLCRISSTIS